MNALDRFGHDLSAAIRIAWFAGQYALTVRRTGPLTRPGEPPFKPSVPLPDREKMLAGMGRLVAQDRQDCEAGWLIEPAARWPDLEKIAGTMRRYFTDLDAVDRRRKAGLKIEVDRPERRGRYPRYYLQNFHYQTEGYLSEESAAVYDWQVETLFSGTARMMRRQGLVPVARHLAGRDQRCARLAELGCGTASFLSEAAASWPRLELFGVDLSRPYLELARQRLGSPRRRHLIEAAAESLPLASASQDVVSAVYLFHELPPKARAAVAAEMARVKKKDGLLVIVDSLQKGDAREFDGLLELFPIGFHEPYFASWTELDVAALFGRHGLELCETRLAYLSKILVFRQRT